MKIKANKVKKLQEKNSKFGISFDAILAVLLVCQLCTLLYIIVDMQDTGVTRTISRKMCACVCVCVCRYHPCVKQLRTRA